MTAAVLARDWRSAALAIGIVSAVVAVLPPEAQIGIAVFAAAALLAGWTLARPTRWLFLFLAAVMLLPPLPASVGDSGPHPAVVFAALGLIAGAARMHCWRFGSRPVVPQAALLALVLLASVSMALLWSGPEIAAGSAARVALFAISPYVLAYMVCGPGRVLAQSDAAPLRVLLWCGMASAVFACLDFAFQFPAPAGYGAQFIWLESGVFRRAQGLFYDTGALGNMCAFFLVMVAAAVVFRSRWRIMSPWLLGAAAIPLTAALVLSYSRAALLNVLAALVALIAMQRRQIRWQRAVLLFSAALTIVALGIYVAAPNFAQAWWDRLQHSFELGFSATDHVLSGRVASWQLLGSFVLEHPLRTLLGVGYKTLPYSDVLGREVIADNTYLSTFIETGVAGLAALLALHVSILRATWRAAHASDSSAAFYGVWAFAFWIGEMVQMAAADLLTYWRLLPLFFFAIGMAVLKSGRERA